MATAAAQGKKLVEVNGYTNKLGDFYSCLSVAVTLGEKRENLVPTTRVMEEDAIQIIPAGINTLAVLFHVSCIRTVEVNG